jgi:hypothetical protein
MWTCPKCGTKVDAAFDVCWQCGTAPDGTEDPTFETADDQGPIPLDGDEPMDSSTTTTGMSGTAAELVPCYQAFSLMEAKFLADQLNDQGITAVCDSQDMQDNLGGWSGNPRVYCHEGDLERAKTFLAEYEKKKAGHNPLEP